MSDTQRCYRVTLYDARRRMTWTPVFAASSEEEAEAKARTLFDRYEFRSVSLIHGSMRVWRKRSWKACRE